MQVLVCDEGVGSVDVGAGIEIEADARITADAFQPRLQRAADANAARKVTADAEAAARIAIGDIVRRFAAPTRLH